MYSIAESCLFLSAKICESPRKYRDVIAAADHANHTILTGDQRPPLVDFLSYKFVDRKEELLENERLILKELGFSVYRLVKDNAHKYLVYLVKEVFPSLDKGVV